MRGLIGEYHRGSPTERPRPPRMRATLPRRWVVTGCLSALLMLVTACGPLDQDPASTATATATAPAGVETPESTAEPGDSPSDGERSFEDALLAHAQCMRDHGIDFPDPQLTEGEGGSQTNVQSLDDIDQDSDEFGEAWEACAGELETGEFDDGSFSEISEADLSELHDAMVEWQQCMQDHGFDVSDFRVDIAPGGNGKMSRTEDEAQDDEQGSGGGRKFDPNDPEAQQAVEECDAILDGESELSGTPQP